VKKPERITEEKLLIWGAGMEKWVLKKETTLKSRARVLRLGKQQQGRQRGKSNQKEGGGWITGGKESKVGGGEPPNAPKGIIWKKFKTQAGERRRLERRTDKKSVGQLFDTLRH